MIHTMLRAFLAAVALVAGPTATTIPLPSRPPIQHIPPAAWTVLCLGDSITLGVGSTDGTGYRGPLHQLLPALVFTGSQGTAPLLHEGHSGYRIDQLDALMPGAVAYTRPAFVLLHAGTNDAVQGRTPATMLANMAALLDAIHTASPNTRVLAALIPTSTWATPAQQAVEAAFDDGLPALAAARLQWVTIVDMHLDPADLGDGVHPTPVGYAKMAARWAAALPEVMAS